MSNSVDPALRGHVGIAVRRGDAEAERIARQNLSEAKIAKAINDVLDVPPALSAEARVRLAQILLSGGN